MDFPGKALIRNGFPSFFRQLRAAGVAVQALLGTCRRYRLKRLILRRHGRSVDPEFRAVADFIRQRGLAMIPSAPYEAALHQPVQVHRTGSVPFPYVQWQGRPIFFPASFSDPEVKDIFSRAQAEQVSGSPHAYTDAGFRPDQGDAALFIGASDGLVCLSLLPRLRRAFVVEPDPIWTEPLRRTFAAEGDRVRIITKFAGSAVRDGWTTIDQILREAGETVEFIQADVEGSKLDVLRGAQYLLAGGKKVRLSLCTYHRREDAEVLARFVEQHGFSAAFSSGYMILWMQIPCPAPYLRRGVLRASRGLSAFPTGAEAAL